MNTGLAYIINFHRISGVSYTGAPYINRKQPLRWRFILIAWDLILLLFSTWFTITQGVNPFHKLCLKGNTIVYRVLCKAVPFLFLSTISINLVLLIRGDKIIKSILNTINETNKLWGSEINEKKLGITITIIQCFIIVIYILLSYTLISLKLKSTAFLISPLRIFDICYRFFCYVNHSAAIALIAYQSKIITFRLHRIKISSPNLEIEQLYYIFCRIKILTTQFDQLISPIIFITIICDCILVIAFLCFLTISFYEAYYFILSNFLILIVFLMALCYVCEIIPNAVSETLDSFQYRLSTNNSTIVTQQQLLLSLHYLKLLYIIKRNIGLTAFGLFKMRCSLFLTLTGLIISYCIILVQTNK